MLKIMIPENWAEKPPPCLFIMDWAGVTQVEYSWSPYYNPYSDSSYPNIFYRLPTLSTFQNTHIYRTTGLRVMMHMEGL